MTTILITGGTGMIGKALTFALLEKNYKVIILTRQTKLLSHDPGNVTYGAWDINKQTIDKEAIARADYIIHLAGAGVADKRWTKKRKQEIINSRVKSSELLVRAIETYPNKVKALISASAIGWYGTDAANSETRPFREDDPHDKTFLGEACKLWEDSIEPVKKSGKRLVKLRTGIVLSNEGGALKEFKKPLRWGVASILGDGKQIISWIHIEDLVRLYITAIEDETMQGVYNAVAPIPVSNKKLVMEMARIQKGKFFIPVYVPSFILKTILGEMSIEVLKSATVSADKIHYTGFIFLHPTIEAALQNLVNIQQ